MAKADDAGLIRTSTPRFAVLASLILTACGGDAADPPDAQVGTPDAAASVDAGGVPLAGFGAITGMCGVIDAAELDGTSPAWFAGELTFARRYDDPADRGELTPGGLEIILDGNAGGSSLYSEVFAFEWMARCELATLLKTETEIIYDIDGKKADLLVEIDGRKVGVSVVRFVKFPFGSPYTLADASPLVQRKIEDLRLATTQVAAVDLWTSQLVVALAYDVQHAQVAMQAWNMLDAQVRGSTHFIVVVTDGTGDMFIYTDQ